MEETMEKALTNIFSKSNEELADAMGINYNTIASWRFNFRHNAMSQEKKIEILTRMNYQLKQESLWKKQAQ
jgi:hypothetical protein